ncbi:hypothetical protein [uncultured Thiodictyon sp.]|uniref:hypothetical protein n=1 Tax=uncultured Thiodictyon sp. TaxID=1846217 RepID=UPI0025FA75DF|nr:hypothetical protein [uncultured Thiodictyon sp.]
MKKTVLRPLLAAALLLGSGTSLFAGEGEDLLNGKDDANAKGYGRNVSQDFSTIAIVNKLGKLMTLRESKNDRESRLNENSTLSYDIPKGEDYQVSLNGGGESDDVVIRDSRGFVEYKADSRSIEGLKHKNVWVNLLTWAGTFWQLGVALDSVDGTQAHLIPWADGKAVKLLVLKSDNGFGRTISLDFKVLRLENKSGKELPLRVKSNGKWKDDGKLASGASRDYTITETEQISLNGDGDGDQDDIKINDAKGYIELLAARVEGVESGNIWITHFWWNSEANKWYGTLSKTGINGNDNMILSALDGANANKATGVIGKGDPLVFTITKK